MEKSGGRSRCGKARSPQALNRMQVLRKDDKGERGGHGQATEAPKSIVWEDPLHQLHVPLITEVRAGVRLASEQDREGRLCTCRGRTGRALQCTRTSVAGTAPALHPAACQAVLGDGAKGRPCCTPRRGRGWPRTHGVSQGKGPRRARSQIPPFHRQKNQDPGHGRASPKVTGAVRGTVSIRMWAFGFSAL